MPMRAGTRLLIACAAGLLAAPGAGRAQEIGASIEVYNRSFGPIDVRILDARCGKVLFAGQIFNESEVQVTACTDADGRARITVQWPDGTARTYSGLESGSQVQLETDQD
jgi:hypothetical protein